MNVLKHLALVVAIATAPLFSGCALILNGTQQRIPIASAPTGANVFVDGAPIGQTPTVYQFDRDQVHVVTIQKEGYIPALISVTNYMGHAVVGNVVLGGLIGWGIDATTGAQYNLEPQVIAVNLERDPDYSWVPPARPAARAAQPARSAYIAPDENPPRRRQPAESSSFLREISALADERRAGEISAEEYTERRRDLLARYAARD